MNEDLEGGLLSRFWNWVKNSNMLAAIAENPSVMTASGWKINRDGSVTLERTKETDLLADTLAGIADAAIAAPTLGADVSAVASAVRHPIQTAKTVGQGIKDIGSYVIRNFKGQGRKLIRQGRRIIDGKLERLPIGGYSYYHDNPEEKIFLSIIEREASKAAEKPFALSRRHKKYFLEDFKETYNDNPNIRELNNLSIRNFLKKFNLNSLDASRLLKIFYNNPEYYQYIKETENLNPLSLETVSAFLERLSTSIRGVHADSEELARQYLTTTEKGRHMPGGDRLSSDGGLYVSNSPTIAHRFKNPLEGTKDGYVAILRDRTHIPTDIPIEEQLSLSRNRITGSYYNLRAPNVEIIESDYVGNASMGKPGQERAYLPPGDGVIPVVDIVDLLVFKNSVNLNGRWGKRITDIGDTSRLFIPKQLNNTTDFILRYRSLYNRKKKIPNYMYESTRDDLYDLFDGLLYTRDDLIYRLNSRLRNINLGSTVGGSGLILGTGIYGYGKLYLNEQDSFMVSQEFQDFRKEVELFKDKHGSITSKQRSHIRDKYFNKWKANERK